MAAPVLQSGEQRATYSSSTSVGVSKPAGVAAGDLLLVEISDNNSTAGWSSPGWTAGPSFDRIFSFWRIADGSEGASFTFTYSGSGRTGAMICHRITGAHQTSPIDVSSGVSVASGVANPVSLPSITTTGPDRLLLAAYYSKTAVVGTSFSTPTGMSAAYAYQTASSGAGQASAFTEAFATAGATGVRDSNSSGTNYARTGFLLAIAPAPLEIPLAAATAQSSASLALSAPTAVPLNPVDAVAAAALTLSAPTIAGLDPASAAASASLSLLTGIAVPLDAAFGLADASLVLSAPTEVPLDPIGAQAAASLDPTAPTVVPLDAASGQADATLDITASAPSCFFLGEPDPLADFTSPDNEFRDAQRTIVAKYTAQATGNIEVLRLLIVCDTSTWDQLDLIIYADSAGEAGAIIDYGTVTGPGATGAGPDTGPVALPPAVVAASGSNTGMWVEATGLSIPVVMGTDYWFGIHARGDGADNIDFVVDDDGTHQSYRLGSYPGFSSPPPDPYDSTAFGYTESIAFQAICAPSVIGTMTAAFSETSEGNAFLSQELAPRISETFDERWSSGLHIGAARPEMRVEIRQGRFNRRYAPWNEGVYPVGAVVGDSDPAKPWQAFWEPTTAYVEIPNVLDVELGKNFDQRGIQTAVIQVENIVYKDEGSGETAYHSIHKGYLSPLRGYVADDRDPLVDERGVELTTGNEWFTVLNRDYQITVHQAYGDEWVKVYTGLIDDVDVTSRPNSITINARCFGQALTDQEIFGWSIDKDLRDPVTFVDHDEADNIHKGGYDPSSSSHQSGHDSPLVNDGDSDTYWASNDHTGAANTEWVQIKVAEGRYEDFWLGTKWANQDIYISVKPQALANGANPTLDGGDLAPDEWVDLSMGTVPGGFGGIPYIRFIDHPNSATTQVRDLNDPLGLFPNGEFVMGADSIIRVSFRNLHDTGGGVYRAGVRSLYSRRRTLVPEAIAQKWIRVRDVSDVVKVILRWAGFKEWEIESAGVRLSKRFLANRGMKYMDVIDKVKETLGYEFYIADPTDDERSIGVPIFRQSHVLADGVEPVITVKHTDLLTAVDLKQTDEPLAYIIRTRGRESKTGDTLGGDTTRRIMATYRPPWSGLGLAGLLKHVIHTNLAYKNADDVKFAAWMIALQEALTSVVVGGEIPAYPGIDLDDIIVLEDLGTGLTTRLQIRERRSTFHTGADLKWTMSFTGAVIDVPDVQAIVAEVRAAGRDNA